MIQKQSNNRRSERAQNHQEQKGATGPEFNKEHADCFSRREGNCSREFVPPNTTVNSDFYCDVLRRSRENVRRKIWNTGATQLAPSSRQHARPHDPETQRVCG
jgi:hypothetical protein